MSATDQTEELIEKVLSFMFHDGPCPGCGLSRSRTTGLVDYVRFGLTPARRPCHVCECVPEGTPAR